MFEIKNTTSYKGFIKSWLHQVHQDVFRECNQWKEYTENETEMVNLIDKLERGELPESERSELFDSINIYQNQAADIMFVMGLRHGEAIHRLLTDKRITDLLEE